MIFYLIVLTNYVPAVAVIRKGLRFIKLTGFKAFEESHYI